MSKNRSLAAGLALWLVLLVAWLALRPGLSGSFRFDDYPNLSELTVAQQPGLAPISQFTFGGGTGSIGRPLSLLSFALQADSWPGHPDDFIRVNILIHLLNGALFCWALLYLLRTSGIKLQTPELLAIAATAFWLLCPLQASSVLYVVQRMTLLAGTCMFVGLLLYLMGREHLHTGRAWSGLALMTGGVGAGLGLGVLAKENAVLFPLLVLVVEATLPHKSPRPRLWRTWAWVCLGVPLALFAGYLAMRFPADLSSTAQLGFTSPERVLSQPRVLLIYLQKTLLPSLYSIRIMYDDLQASTSLISPWTTAPAWLAWISLVALAFRTRKRWPLLAFAVFWFLAGHSLESSFIPMELAFDHRNYVPIAGLALFVVWSAAQLLAHPWTRLARGLFITGISAYALFMVTALWQSASLWGQPYALIAYWHEVQPDSRRVSYEMSDVYLRMARPDEALRVDAQSLERWPGDTTIAIAMLTRGCLLTDHPMPSLTKIQTSLGQYDGHSHTTQNLLHRLILLAENGLCDRYSPQELSDLVDAVFAAPAFKQYRLSNRPLFLARIHYSSGRQAQALAELDLALAVKPSHDLYEVAVGWALDAHQPDRARAYLDAAEKLAARRPLRAMSFAPIYERLRERIDSYPAQPSTDSG